MSDNSDVSEVELYEEVVRDVHWNSPVRIQTSSVVPVAFASAKGLHITIHVRTIIIDSCRQFVEATDFLFARAPRPDPRDPDKLAEAPRKVPRYSDGVAATLARKQLVFPTHPCVTPPS